MADAAYAAAPGDDGSPSGTVPGSAREALDMIMAGFGWLAGADLASVPAAAQAECLRELERARSVQTAAHAAVLAAFDATLGYQADAYRSPRTWLIWQTQVTPATATAAAGWMRRLAAHPAVNAALAAAQISASAARQVCDWTDPLPGTARGDADAILLRAAAGGAGLGKLLAAECQRASGRTRISVDARPCDASPYFPPQPPQLRLEGI